MALPVSFDEIARIASALRSLRFDPNGSEYETALDRFGEMFAKLSAEERSLVVHLTEEFLVYHFSDYHAALQSLLNKLDPADVRSCNELIILPLSETKSDGEPKSASVLIYPAVNMLKASGAFTDIPIRSFERMELVPRLMRTRTCSYFVFVDDFVGTGDTAVDAINRFRNDIKQANDRFIVLSLVAQQRGLDAMAAISAPYLVKDVRGMGITNSISLEDYTASLAVMDAIERRLQVDRDYRRGWKGSEALVKMIRCPDNTFPVFWQTTRSRPWPAPFPREQV
jgi:hypothetical protein